MATIDNIFQALGYFGSNEAYFQMIDTVDDINCVEEDSSFNLLQLAISNGYYYAISMLRGDKCYYYDNVIELLKYGADLHNVNKYGHTPMERIIELDDKDLLVAIEPYI